MGSLTNDDPGPDRIAALESLLRSERRRFDDDRAAWAGQESELTVRIEALKAHAQAQAATITELNAKVKELSSLRRVIGALIARTPLNRPLQLLRRNRAATPRSDRATRGR